MYRIAKQFEEPYQSDYIKAATNFRLPYWDPWMPRHSVDRAKGQQNWGAWFGVPAILRAQEVFVRRPDNPEKLVPIDNPLYRYKTPPHRDLLPEAKVGWTDFFEAVRRKISPIIH